MTRKGPAPKPTALRKLQGNPSKRPFNEAEPSMTAKKPNCPSWLSDYAKTVWRRLSGSLFDMGILRYEDVFAFAAFCESVALWRRAVEELQDAPLTQTADSGYQGQHPAVYNYNAAMEKMLKAAALFGMTPSDRSKLRIEEVEKELTLAEELFQMTQAMEDAD